MKCTDCHKKVRPVIASDIDGTLAEYHTAVTMFAARYYDMSVPTFPYDGSVPFRDYLGLTKEQHRVMKLAYRQGGNKRSLKLYNGARAFIDFVKSEGAELWVATTRPWQRLDNIDPDTQEWLRRNGIEIDGLLFGDDKYQQLIDAVGKDRIVGVVDDLAAQIDAATALGLPAWQVHRDHNSARSERRAGGALFPGATLWASQQIKTWRGDWP